MTCEFPEYPVERYVNTSVRLAGRQWVEAKEKAKDTIEKGLSTVMTIVGDPGMGKTAILNAVYNDLKEDAYLVFVDLSGKDSIAEPAWAWVDGTLLGEKVKNRAFNVLYENRRAIGYTTFTWMRREFGNWLRKKCGEGIEGELNYALRLYCLGYPRDLDGLVQFLNDLKALGKAGVLVDELHLSEGVMSELHRLINVTGVPIVVTAVRDVVAGLTDLPLRRRLEENVVELRLTHEDAREILKAYCPDFADDLIGLEEVVKATRVNELLRTARLVVMEAQRRCEGEYKREECIRGELSKSLLPEDVQEASTQLEKAIREELMRVKEDYRIAYVHERGKRVESVGTTVDLYFVTDSTVYLGDVKLSNNRTLSEAQLTNVRRLKDVNSLEGKAVVRFIVTNADVPPLDGFKVVKIPTKRIRMVLDGDLGERERLVGEMLKELGLPA